MTQFMWRRRCSVLGVDAFEQILKDISTHYHEDNWKSLAAVYNTDATTHRKHRKSINRGLQLVSHCIVAISPGITYVMHLASFHLLSIPYRVHLAMHLWKINLEEFVLGNLYICM